MVFFSLLKRLFQTPVLCGVFDKELGWFRVFGIGVSWKDVNQHGLMFSERYGHRKHIRIGSYVFRFLPLERS